MCLSKVFMKTYERTHRSWTHVISTSTSKTSVALGGCTPSYVLHTRAFGTYLLGGVIYLAERIIR